MRERMYLIAQLEAHYGRWLAHAVIANHQSAVAMQNKPQRRELTMKDFVTWTQNEFDIAQERETLIQAAHGLEDEEFEIMVKWRTLPKWAEAMAELGYTWNMDAMKWQQDGRNVF